MLMKSEMDKTQRLVMTALMMTLVLLGTAIFRIPVPMTQGYVHLGDAMVFIGVMMLGRKNGTVAAGLGSAMADILGGFAVWAPWTLFIKAAMAFTAGSFIERSYSGHRHAAGFITGMTLGGMLMCAGYYIAEGVMYGNWAAAALGIPWNIGQFIIGMMIAMMFRGAVSSLR